MRRGTILRYAPFLVTIIGLAVVLALCHLLFERDEAQMHGRTDAELRHIALQVQSGLESRVDPLNRLARWWMAQGRPLEEDWSSDAELFLNANNGLLAVYWTDAAQGRRWTVPVNAPAAYSNEAFRLVVDLAHKKGGTVTSDLVFPTGSSPEFYICVPVRRQGRLEGYMTGLYSVSEVLDSMLRGQLPPDYHVAVQVAGRRIYGWRTSRQTVADYAPEAPIPFLNAVWTVQVWLSSDALEHSRPVILTLGAVVAVLLYVGAVLALLSRRRAADLEAANEALRTEMTERRRAEEKISELNASLSHRLADFEALVEVIPIGIVVAEDPECHEVWMNRTLARMVNVLPSANISKTGLECDRLPFRLCRDGKEIPGPELPMQKAASTGKEILGVEMDLVRGDGTVVNTLSYVAPLFDQDGRVRRILSACVDITERKAAETERLRLLESEQAARLHSELTLAALHASEDKFRRLIDSDVIGVVIANSKQVLEANGSYLRMVGYTRDDLLAGRICWPEMTSPEYRDADEQLIRELRSTGRFEPVERELTRKDGSTMPVLIGGALLEDGFDFTSICFVLDLTERRELEHRLRRAQKLESLGIMAAGIAHDFNNILTSIIGNASLAMEKLGVEHPSRECLAAVLESGERAAELIYQILAYTGRAHYRIGAVNLTELVSGMRPMIRKSVPVPVDVRFDLDRQLPPAEADAAEIRQAVLRLVVNAVEAIGKAPGVITISTSMCSLDEREISEFYPDQALAPGRYICLAVTDTGCGVPAEIKSRIFDPFFTTKFTGRGLGLSAVLGTMRAHHGGIRVDTASAQGTRFDVVFPAVG